MKKPNKKMKTGIRALYDTHGSSLVRLKSECPRCGKGIFLADHHDRHTCGRCGYTLFKKKNNQSSDQSVSQS